MDREEEWGSSGDCVRLWHVNVVVGERDTYGCDRNEEIECIVYATYMVTLADLQWKYNGL